MITLAHHSRLVRCVKSKIKEGGPALLMMEKLPLIIASFISNTLIPVCVAVVATHPIDITLVFPVGVALLAFTLGLAIKFFAAVTNSLYPTATCSTLFVFTSEYTMPSIHATMCVIVAAHLTRRYWPSPTTSSSSLPSFSSSTSASLISDDQYPTNTACYIRIACAWLYAAVLCFSRMYMRVNDSWDLIAGVALANAFILLEIKGSPIFYEALQNVGPKGE